MARENLDALVGDGVLEITAGGVEWTIRDLPLGHILRGERAADGDGQPDPVAFLREVLKPLAPVHGLTEEEFDSWLKGLGGFLTLAVMQRLTRHFTGLSRRLGLEAGQETVPTGQDMSVAS